MNNRVHAVANDMEDAAIAAIVENVAHNRVGDCIEISHRDAIACMVHYRQLKAPFHVIDLDPFGPCGMFLPTAIATIRAGGIVCATDTDMPTLLGKTPHAAADCFAQYGGLPIRYAAYGKEMALRLVLGQAARSAALVGRSIRPLLSMSMDFYVRVHFQVLDGATLPPSLSIIYQCQRCCYFSVPSSCLHHNHHQHHASQDHDQHPTTCPLCPEKDSAPLQLGGPFWSGALHDTAVLNDILIASTHHQHALTTTTTTMDKTTTETTSAFSRASWYVPYGCHQLLSIDIYIYIHVSDIQ